MSFLKVVVSPQKFPFHLLWDSTLYITIYLSRVKPRIIHHLFYEVLMFSFFFFLNVFITLTKLMTTSASLYIAQVRFCRALAVVRCLPTESGGAFQPSISDRLNLYGLYKQTLAGDCMLLKPSSRNIVQYAKWLEKKNARYKLHFHKKSFVGKLGIDFEE